MQQGLGSNWQEGRPGVPVRAAIFVIWAVFQTSRALMTLQLNEADRDRSKPAHQAEQLNYKGLHAPPTLSPKAAKDLQRSLCLPIAILQQVLDSHTRKGPERLVQEAGFWSDPHRRVMNLVLWRPSLV